MSGPSYEIAVVFIPVKFEVAKVGNIKGIKYLSKSDNDHLWLMFIKDYLASERFNLKVGTRLKTDLFWFNIKQ